MKKKTIRCKACGYLMAEGSNYEECPACGVPSKMFEPYDDKVPEERAWLLRYDLHGVVAHAPMGLTFIMLILAAVGLVLGWAGSGGSSIYSYVMTTLVVLSVVLPIVVAATFGAGLIDGKYRYKKVTTKRLVQKILLGSVFFVLSVGMLIVAILPEYVTSASLQIVYLIVNAAAFGCTVYLGLWGAGLVHGIMPGPWLKKKKPGAPAAPAAPAEPQA